MISEIRKGFNVKRFHTLPRIQEETVGHHSANVQAIILRLDPECRRELLLAALFHDVGEYYTGDVPYPFKVENEKVKEGLKAGEDHYRFVNAIPNFEIDLSEDEYKLLKLADMLDCALSGIEDKMRGNQCMSRVIVNAELAVKSMGLDDDIMHSIVLMVSEVTTQYQARDEEKTKDVS